MKVLFAGPSLFGASYDAAGLTVRPPARQGDIHDAVREGATAIGLVDGVFGFVASVWHKEILFALSEGVAVLGAASLGALRAAECQPFGMRPVGAIAAEYLAGTRRDDGDVCLVHGPAELDFMPLSEPLVDVEATLAAMRAAGVATDAEAAALLGAAQRLYFGDREIDRLCDEAGHPGLAKAYRQHRVGAKSRDALELVEQLQQCSEQRGPRPDWQFVASDPWRYYLGQLAREEKP
jgi:hypothetical protein